MSDLNDTEEPIYFYSKTMAWWGLSNFSPPGIEQDGVFWPTIEHFFQAQKFDSLEMKERIRRTATPKLARELGQSRAHPIRSDWDDVRDDIMLCALRVKFAQPAASKLLLSTGDKWLVEASPFDYYWGAGQDGSGRNRLGELLMQVRRELLAR
jgi:N-glycosidase YbiA